MSQKTKESHLLGLTTEQVLSSREKHGENLLTPPERPSIWKLYLEKFQDPVIKVLLVAAAFSLIISIIENEYAETIGIFFAIFLATGIGFYFEYDANKKFDLLNAVSEETPVTVIRNGKIHEIPRKDIVVGDVVILNTGEEIPADGVLLEAVSLQVNESNLTGELMVNKTTKEADFDEEATYPSNVVMRGTTVTDGHGVMRVERVGDRTEIGKVARQSTEQSEEETPLNIQLTKLANLIGKVGFTIATLTFLIFTAEDLYGFFTTTETTGWNMVLPAAQIVLKYFMMAVTLIVVAVPEGLPMSVTLSLALNMRRMLKTNNLVRKMHACETMGAINVICTDKTGTLTQNLMQVYEAKIVSAENMAKVQKAADSNKVANANVAANANIATNDKAEATIAHDTPNATKTNDTAKAKASRTNVQLTDEMIQDLVAENIAANSTAFLEEKEDGGKPTGVGNPTEVALLLWLHENGRNYIDLREGASIVSQLTFSTERKYMATLVESPIQQQRILYIKGAPEIVMSKCNLSDETIQSYNEQLLAYQHKAMRTLGLAYKVVGENESTDCAELVKQGGLTTLGVFAISDPIRPDVPAAVQKCQSAGIGVKIVTGDTPGTATEIARQIGLWKETDTERNRITGSDFAALSDEEALERVVDLKVMSRARPMDKQRLVQLLQQKGAVVAVTGDGTNDAPALNHAQVGLSMGTGTSVAKEASDITLLDDSFHSIATAVMWGRSLYKNIQRFIVFQLTINVVALLSVLLGAFFGTTLPLTVTQMLWVNLIMDTFAAMALASISPSVDVMNEKPRHRDDFIITKAMRNNIFGVGLTFLALLMGLLIYYKGQPGGMDTHHLTIFFTIFVMLQFWNLFNASVFGTNHSVFKDASHALGMLSVALIILVGQIFIVTFGGKVFRTEPLSLMEWISITAGTSLVFWIGEAVRGICRLKKKNQTR